MAMASKDALKRMVMQFRITELQALLEFAGKRNKTGRKKDLQKKALNLISSKRCSTLHNKIFHLHQSLSNKDSADEITDSSYFPSFKDRYNHMTNRFLKNYSSLYNGHTNEDNGSSFYNDVYDSSDSVESNSTRLNVTKSNFQNYDMKKLDNFTFNKLPFFEYINEVIPVTPLIPKKQDDDVFEFDLAFTLKPEIMSRLTESQYQLQVRMCTLAQETEVTDSLPLSLSIKVNDKYCTLPPPIPSTNRQGMLLKRMNVPINITPEIHRRSSVNQLAIGWSIECDELYGITIHLVRKYTSDELIDKLKEKGERDPDLTKKVIYNNLNDEDNEICAMSLKMSLVCPLGKILIALPVRATTCNHLQCFDGALYIKMNDVKSTWMCPICNQACLYQNLFIDGYFSNVLKSEAFLSNVTEIELDADGSWTPVLPKKRKLSDTSSPSISKKQNTLPSPVAAPPVLKKSEINLAAGGDSNDLANDLQDFYYQYNKDTELCSYRSSYPILPSFNEISNHFLDVKPVSERQESVISSQPKAVNGINKKNVMLVDLTISDSDSDDIRSLSDDDTDSDSLQISSRPEMDNCLPPVYDISDSDCEEL